MYSPAIGEEVLLLGARHKYPTMYPTLVLGKLSLPAGSFAGWLWGRGKEAGLLGPIVMVVVVEAELACWRGKGDRW